MKLAEMLKISPYSLTQEKKEKVLLEQLIALTTYHREKSLPYARIAQAIATPHNFTSINHLPYLPVSLFKTHQLMSIAEEEIFKVLTSSGTTTSQPSKIYLDRETAQLQTAALVNIMSSWLGQKRLPMLIIDAPNVIKDRYSYSARGAGILGMLNFGRDHFYALDDHMELNRQGLAEWSKKYAHEPVLLFGFTFMVWKHFLCTLEMHELSLPKGILIHSGGWKKMQEQAVSNADFKQALQAKIGIKQCHGFYGMVEQVGSVFVECEQGCFHCPSFCDVVNRQPKTWQEVSFQQEGIVQVLSILPKSYPGHSLLTEDRALYLGVDDCLCQRKGKYFHMIGRVPKTELRGCSDVYAHEN